MYSIRLRFLGDMSDEPWTEAKRLTFPLLFSSRLFFRAASRISIMLPTSMFSIFICTFWKRVAIYQFQFNKKLFQISCEKK